MFFKKQQILTDCIEKKDREGGRLSRAIRSECCKGGEAKALFAYRDS